MYVLQASCASSHCFVVLRHLPWLLSWSWHAKHSKLEAKNKIELFQKSKYPGCKTICKPIYNPVLWMDNKENVMR